MVKSRDEEMLSSWDVADEIIDDWENIHRDEVASAALEQVVQTATSAEDEVSNVFKQLPVEFIFAQKKIRKYIQITHLAFVDGFGCRIKAIY